MSRGRLVALGALVVVGVATASAFVALGPGTRREESAIRAGRDAATTSDPSVPIRHRTRTASAETSVPAQERPPLGRAEIEALPVLEVLERLARRDDEEQRLLRERLRGLASVDPAWMPAFIEHIHEMRGCLEVFERFGPGVVEPLAVAATWHPKPAPSNIREALRGMGRGDDAEAFVAEVRRLALQAERRQWAMDVLAGMGPAGVRALASLLSAGYDDGGRLDRWARDLGADALPLVRARWSAAGADPPGRVLTALSRLVGAGGEFAGDLERLVEDRPDRAPEVAVTLPALGAAGVPLARRLLANPNRTVRITTLQHLPHLGDAGRALAEELLARLEEGDQDRVLLARALQQVGRAEATVAHVQARIESGTETADDIAVLAVSGPAGRHLLARHWSRWATAADAGIRAAAAGAVAAFRDDVSEFAAALGRLANDDDPRVATAALLVLRSATAGRAGAAPELGVTVDRMLREAKTSEAPPVSSRRGGGISGRTSVGGRILRANEGQVMEPRSRLLAALGVLGQIGRPAGDQAHQVVRVLESDPDPHLRDAALRALIGIGGDTEPVALRQILEPNGNVVLGLRLLATADGALSSRARAVLWELARSEPKSTPAQALEVLETRRQLSVASVPELLELATGDNPAARLPALRLAARFVSEVKTPTAALEAATSFLDDPDAKLRAAAAQVLLALGPRAGPAVDRLVALSAKHPDAAYVLGSIGAVAVERSVRHLSDLDAAAATRFEEGFLGGAQARSERGDPAHTRATCRSWLEARYGAFETRTGLPRDIPNERSELLRWAVYEATVTK